MRAPEFQKFSRSSSTQTRNVWLTVVIMLVLAAYRFAVHMQDTIQLHFPVHARVSVADWLINALFFWLLILLWIAYRRWRRAVLHMKELDTIVSSIGPDVLIVIDANRTITLCNGAIERMYGYSVEQAVGAKTDLLYFDRRMDGGKNEIRDDLEQKGFHVGRAKGRRSDGETFPLEVITATLNQTPGAVLLLRDITEREKLEAQLVTLSTHDELTGLLNRRGFFEAGLQQLKFSKRYKLDMFLMFTDLNKFKQINDTLGHQVGDEALKATAQLLRTHLRDADIIGRLGGDEFAILGVSDTEESGQMALARLESEFENYRDPHDRFRLSTSIGMAFFHPDSPETLDDLVSQADARMYEAKTKRKTGGTPDPTTFAGGDR